MKKIAFIGTGAMGARMAAQLIEAGNHVCVNNRTQSKAASLLARGATWAATPQEAARGADLVISMVRDDQASSAVWLDRKTGALGALAPDSVAVECSTVSPAQIAKLRDAFAPHPARLIDAPVAGTLPQAEAGQLIFLAGGAPEVLARVSKVFAQMGQKTVRVGDAGAGAVFKLVVNGLLGLQVVGLSELLAFAEAQGLSRAQCSTLLSQLPVTSAAAAAALPAISTGEHTSWFPVELVEKDFSYITGEKAPLYPLVLAAREAFGKSISNGSGQRHLTAVSDLYRKKVASR